MASVVYNDAKASILNNEFDWSGNTYKLAFVSSSYTPNIDTHTYHSDLTNIVATSSALAGLTVTVDDTNDLAYLDATDVVMTTQTWTARAAVLFEDTGTSATSKLICYIDYTTDISPYADTFTHTFASDGVLKLS